MKSQRRSTEKRKNEIIQATLKLAEKMPVTKITTRQIARQVGISQPALFRHYKSSSQIFEAAIEHVRQEIGNRAVVFFQSEQLQASDLKTKLSFIMNTLAEFPGLPRLFYYYRIQSKPSAARTNMMHLLSIIQTMIGTLIREDTEISSSVDEVLAAKYLISLIQGQQLEYCHTEETECVPTPKALFVQTIENTISFWFEGLKARHPPKQRQSKQTITPQKEYIELDVRPEIAAGRDPLNLILNQLNHLSPLGCLRLITPFQPNPLIALLQSRGYEVKSFNIQSLWHSVIVSKKTSFHDFTDLEAPLPLEKTLALSATMKKGETLWIQVPRIPNLLFPHLRKRAIEFNTYSGDHPPVLLQLHKKEETA